MKLLRLLVHPPAMVPALLLLAACGEAVPSPTPLPTTSPTPPAEAAASTAEDFLSAWAAGDYAAMHALLAPEDRARYGMEAFSSLLQSFRDLADATELTFTAGDSELVALPPAPRSSEFPPPTPPPSPSTDPSTGVAPGASGDPAPATSPPPSASPAPSADPA
jgi:hypothetical protein